MKSLLAFVRSSVVSPTENKTRGILISSNILLPVAAIFLASCSGPSTGEVAVLDEVNKYFPKGIFSGSQIRIWDVDSNLPENEQVELLKKAGYVVNEARGKIGNYFPYVDGKNGDSVNRVAMSPSLFSSVTLEKKTLDETAVQLFYAGGTLQKFQLSKNFRTGSADLDGTIQALAKSFGRDIQLTTTNARTSEKGATVSLPVEGTSKESELRIRALPCDGNGGGSSSNKGYLDSMWTDLDSKNSNGGGRGTICSLVVVFETPQAMHDARGEESLHSTSLYSLREKYVEKFGTPDCWVQDKDCLPKDSIEAIVTKLDKKMPTH